MTLHYAIRSFLESLLEWAKKWRDYFGAIQKEYQQKLDEERLIAKLHKERKAKEKKERLG